ncbi:MAG: hypothetical protein EXR77_07660 [Myxococcales bacterium]|nr:hypothetical protein [Myxococcales bacterium]
MRSLRFGRSVALVALFSGFMSIGVSCTDSAGGDGTSTAEGDGVAGSEAGQISDGTTTESETASAETSDPGDGVPTSGETVQPVADGSGDGSGDGAVGDTAVASCPGGPGCPCLPSGLPAV